MSDIEFYHRDQSPRTEFVGNSPYSDDPDDYITIIERDGTIVSGPRASFDLSELRRIRTTTNTYRVKRRERHDWKKEGF